MGMPFPASLPTTETTAIAYEALSGDDYYSGTLPTQVGLLTRTTWIVLDNNNKFTGSLPSQLGSLTELQDGLLM